VESGFPRLKPRHDKTYKESKPEKRQEYEVILKAESNEDGSNIIYVDEAGIDKEPIRQHGWSKIGQRCFGEVSGLRHSRTSMIAGYSRVFKSLIAPKSYKGTTDSEIFYDWLERDLLPQLHIKTTQTRIQNWVIVVDNAQIHKSLKVKNLVESQGFKLLFLPPYSPDLNPIEHVWWTLKLYLMKIRTSTQAFYQDIDHGIRKMCRLCWD
jgi:transposase